MTTLSTVGYGDITPTSDIERGYSMGAMVVGGAFYGYIVAGSDSYDRIFDVRISSVVVTSPSQCVAIVCRHIHSVAVVVAVAIASPSPPPS